MQARAQGDVHRWVAAGNKTGTVDPSSVQAVCAGGNLKSAKARGFAMEWSLTVLKDEA